ncbi:hypothetical protein [Dysgonomonas sp. HGC4]|uniref:hypothetical protein n=1 Tax=Dysgonomonas sp. HGC4 TaxID=1658009 RepID=UPI00068321C5|nr:hypothetical protein [Dysgonomonas sp. HGC4]MBD8348580.1 hypothetical protein [Dysgonomonas sp. HGC4]
MSDKLPEGITAEMIANAKTKYGQNKVKLIDLPIDEDNTAYKTVLATVPTRAIIGQYMRWDASDPKKAQEILVKNCLLSHKDEVLADDGLFYGALNSLSELIPVRKGIIKNC